MCGRGFHRLTVESERTSILKHNHTLNLWWTPSDHTAHWIEQCLYCLTLWYNNLSWSCTWSLQVVYSFLAGGAADDDGWVSTDCEVVLAIGESWEALAFDSFSALSLAICSRTFCLGMNRMPWKQEVIYVTTTPVQVYATCLVLNTPGEFLFHLFSLSLLSNFLCLL